jgi:hypothetical protein
MMGKTVAKPLGLFQRGGVYSLRVMIPTDLPSAYGGRSKLIESLGTRNRHEADRLAAERRAAVLTDFSQKRRELHTQPLTHVTSELSALLAERVRVEILARDDLMRRSQGVAFLMSAADRTIHKKSFGIRYLTDPPPLLPPHCRTAHATLWPA